eukprot:gene6981-8220_t
MRVKFSRTFQFVYAAVGLLNAELPVKDRLQLPPTK